MTGGPTAGGPTAGGSAGGSVLLGIYEKALVATPTWEEFFPQVSAGGFGFVDLSIDETPERSARLDWDREQRAAVARAAAEAGVLIGGLCLSVHRAIMPGSTDPEMRARAREILEKAIWLAYDLRVGVVQLAGYYAHYEPEDPKARERYVETMLTGLPLAAQLGIVLAIENVDGHDIASIGDAMSVVREADSPWFQVYPDVGNIAEHGGDAAQELLDGEGHMVAIHVKDVLPGQPRRIPFGEGVADFDAAFAELARQGWSGRVMLEMWNDDAPDSLERCIRAREFITDKAERAGLRVLGANALGANALGRGTVPTG